MIFLFTFYIDNKMLFLINSLKNNPYSNIPIKEIPADLNLSLF
jgi:hypothetical protein